MTDWETRYYEAQASHTEANGMLTSENERLKRLHTDAFHEAERWKEREAEVRAYAELIAGEAKQACDSYMKPNGVMDFAQRCHYRDILSLRVALAKNPNPAPDELCNEDSAKGHGAESPEAGAGAGYGHETWPQGDPYPWIVREPSGQCWGPFPTNEAAGKWADDNKIDTCDFEDVMPPPELRHQSGKKSQCSTCGATDPNDVPTCSNGFHASRPFLAGTNVHQVNREPALKLWGWWDEFNDCPHRTLESAIAAQSGGNTLRALYTKAEDSQFVAGKKS